MELALKAKKNNTAIAILLTLGLIVGIPLIVVGAINMDENKGFAALLAVGIVLVVAGFYGSPVAWARLGTLNQELTLVQAVTNEHLHTVADLSQRLSMNGKQTSATLNSCIKKGYLTGFIREGDTLVLNENRALAPTTLTVDCPRCGATFTLQKGDTARCPYCGSVVPTDRK